MVQTYSARFLTIRQKRADMPKIIDNAKFEGLVDENLTNV